MTRTVPFAESWTEAVSNLALFSAWHHSTGHEGTYKEVTVHEGTYKEVTVHEGTYKEVIHFL